MPPNLSFFLFALSFLSGVAYASLGLTLVQALVPAAILAAVLYASNINLRIAVLAAILMIAGSAYYMQDDYRYRAAIVSMPASPLQGIVAADPKQQADFQTLYLKTDYGTIAIQTAQEPRYAYGDTLVAKGKLDPPTSRYYSRHVVGMMRNPSLMRISSGGGNPVLAYLFSIKNAIGDKYAKLLPPRDAALLFGIMFGDNSRLSPEFSTALAQSGLRFITAIDGLHMQIVILIVFFALVSFLPHKYAYLITFTFIGLYVALTGFTLSGIRASFMALLAAFAKETHRLYMPHTILACAALLLTFINPKMLFFDAGFQLSFLAVIAIIYLLPVLRHFTRLGASPGILSWRESLLIAISVQLATAPVVITQFQSFALTSFVASVAVVWMLPFILVFGFLLALFSLVAYPFAALLGFAVTPMIEFVVMAVSLFSRVAVLFNPSLGFPGIGLYYGALVSLMYWHYHTHAAVDAVVDGAAKPEPSPIDISAEVADFEIIEIQ